MTSLDEMFAAFGLRTELEREEFRKLVSVAPSSGQAPVTIRIADSTFDAQGDFDAELG